MRHPYAPVGTAGWSLRSHVRPRTRSLRARAGLFVLVALVLALGGSVACSGADSPAR